MSLTADWATALKKYKRQGGELDIPKSFEVSCAKVDKYMNKVRQAELGSSAHAKALAELEPHVTKLTTRAFKEVIAVTNNDPSDASNNLREAAFEIRNAANAFLEDQLSLAKKHAKKPKDKKDKDKKDKGKKKDRSGTITTGGV
jgi:hypothetical protein